MESPLSAVPNAVPETGPYGLPLNDDNPFGAPLGECIGGFLPPDGTETDLLPLDSITAAITKAARDTWQPTLSDDLFPPVRRADVPMVKVSVSGTIELTQEQYQAYLDGQRLGPGAVVEIRAAGYVVQPGAAWVKRTEGTGEDREVRFEREGRVKIRLTELGELTPTGEEWSE